MKQTHIMGKKGKGGESGGDEDVKRDKPLQAVLLADSFTSTFRPVSFETPKVLFPLANVPMLAYSLDFLASNNVKQVFVFSIAHAEQIRAYVESSGWGDRMDIKCLSSGSCRSAGDVMRDLDHMGVIESDPFILLSGDVVSNVDLTPYLQAHRERRKQRAENIMTMLFRRVVSEVKAKRHFCCKGGSEALPFSPFVSRSFSLESQLCRPSYLTNDDGHVCCHTYGGFVFRRHRGEPHPRDR